MIYRKHGSVARWENGTLVRVVESGIAIEEGDYFECRPMWSAATPVAAVDGRRVEAVASRAATAVAALHIERLIVTHGIAEHECDGRTWLEETDRIHASLTHGKLRALVDATTGRLEDLFTIARALQRAEPGEREPPPALRLDPIVTAALLPHLAGRAPENVRVVQTPGGVDGYGNAIVETARDWPNVYRPSYRVRPVRMPLDLRIECAETRVGEDLPRAVALLAPVSGLTMRVLIEDGRRVFPASVTVSRIRAVAAERTWYPYGGGSFGAAMML